MLFDLQDVHYTYEDGTTALRAGALRIHRGERIAILGANGSGKSTLLRVVDGLVFPRSGVVRFEGQTIDEVSLKRQPDLERSLRSTVGFVFQNADAQLFSACVMDEVGFGLAQLGLQSGEVERRSQEVLAFLGIEHLADRPPFRLSGGEKRKVAIASVLAMNPAVMLFDEPFLGLDPRSQSWLLRTLGQLQAVGKTTIVATHTLDLVHRIAQRVILLSEDHEVLGDGPVDAILSDLDLLSHANVIEREYHHAQ